MLKRIPYLLIFLLLLGLTNLYAKKKDKPKGDPAIPTITKKDVEEQAIFIEGMQAYLLGNTQDALARFNEVLSRDPKNDAAMYMLAKMAYESGNMDKVIQYAQEAIKINPSNEYYYQYLAEAMGEKKDFLGASRVYESLINIKPKDYDYYYDWAYMLTNAGLFKQALEVYNQLESRTGVQEELIFQKQPLLIKLGRIEDAAQDVEKLVKLYPGEPKYIALIGEIYQSNRMYDKAVQTYDRLLLLDPNNADAMLALATTYKKKGDVARYDKIIQNLFGSKEIGIDTKILSFIPYIEKLSRDTTIREEVLRISEILLVAHPDDVKSITARADVLYNIGRKKEAQQAYIKAIYLNDVPSTVWMQLYILDYELEAIDTLIAHSQQGIKKYPKDAFGYFYNAIAHQQQKHYREAGNSLLDAFAIQRSNKETALTLPAQLKLQMLISLGDISYELKDYERSDSAYEAALEIDPNNATVLNNYAYYLCERGDMLEKAEKMSKKSNLLVDNNSAFMDTYAWIMYKLRNYSDALEWIEQVMQLSDAQERPELLIHYGDILLKAGQADKAIEQWQRAINKGGDKAVLEDKIKQQRNN